MKNKYVPLICISTIVSSILLSTLVCLLFRQHIVSIDLVKILNAQAFYANKFISENPQDRNWIHAMKEENASIREKVRLIAGQDAIVMVAPSIIQGADDITDRVLVALGLPNKLPNMKALQRERVVE